MKVRLFYIDEASGDRRPLDTAENVKFSVKKTNNIWSDGDLELERTTEITLPHTLRNDKAFYDIITPNAEGRITAYGGWSKWRKRVSGGIEIDGVESACEIIITTISTDGYKATIVFGDLLPLREVMSLTISELILNPDGLYTMTFGRATANSRRLMSDYGPNANKPHGWTQYYTGRGNANGLHASLDLMFALNQLQNRGFTVSGFERKPILLALNYAERIRDNYHVTDAVDNYVGRGTGGLRNILGSDTPLVQAYSTRRGANGLPAWTQLSMYAPGQTITFYPWMPTDLVLVAATKLPEDQSFESLEAWNNWDNIEFVGDAKAVIDEATGVVSLEGQPLAAGYAVYIDRPCLPVNLANLQRNRWQDGQGVWHFCGFNPAEIELGGVDIMSRIDNIVDVWNGGAVSRSLVGNRKNIAPQDLTVRDVLKIYRLFGGVSIAVNGRNITLCDVYDVRNSEIKHINPTGVVESRKGVALVDGQKAHYGAEMTEANTQEHDYYYDTHSANGPETADYFFVSDYAVMDYYPGGKNTIEDYLLDGSDEAQKQRVQKHTIYRVTELYDPTTPSAVVHQERCEPTMRLCGYSRDANNPLTVTTCKASMSYLDYTSIKEVTRINVEGVVYTWIESSWTDGVATFTLQTMLE